jgi:hypothetical protein
MASRKRAAVAAVIPLAPPPTPHVDGVAYSSLRLKEQGHPLRFGTSAKLVQAMNDQTITFRSEPYPHFLVMPGGVEYPVDNVASALNIHASVVQKLSRTGRLNERKQRMMKVAEAKRTERAATGVQVIDDEDDEPLTSEGDDDES